MTPFPSAAERDSLRAVPVAVWVILVFSFDRTEAHEVGIVVISLRAIVFHQAERDDYFEQRRFRPEILPCPLPRL